MANEESGNPLRRWRQFYSAFDAVDDAIEAAGHPRASFLDMRARILKLLRAAADDDAVGEQLCSSLDDVMAESLKTLLVTPVPHGALASTDLARAVGALANHHESPRIRRLAGDVVRGWTEANVATTNTVKEELQKLPADDGILRHGISTAVKTKLNEQKMEAKKTEAKKSIEPKLNEQKMEAKKTEAKKSIEPKLNEQKMEAKKTEAKKSVAAQSVKMEAKKPIVNQSEKIEATKRKLHEGYEEAKKVKRQHTIKNIDVKEAAKSKANGR